MIQHETRAYLAASVSVLIWSGNFVFARGIIEYAPPISISFFRWVVAILTLTPFAIHYVRRDWALVKQHWPFLLKMGFVGISVFNTFVYIAGHHTQAANISLISALSPVFVAVLAWRWLGEHIKPRQYIGMALAFIGLAVVVLRGQWSHVLAFKFNEGDILLLLGAFGWALWTTWLPKRPEKMHLISFMYVQFVLGLLTLSPVYLWEFSQHGMVDFTPPVVSMLLYVGIMASLVAFFFWQYSVQQIGPARTAPFYYTIPIFTSLLAYFLLDEPIQPYHVVGAACIISGVYLAGVRKKLRWRRKR